MSAFAARLIRLCIVNTGVSLDPNASSAALPASAGMSLSSGASAARASSSFKASIRLASEMRVTARLIRALTRCLRRLAERSWSVAVMPVNHECLRACYDK